MRVPLLYALITFVVLECSVGAADFPDGADAPRDEELAGADKQDGSLESTNVQSARGVILLGNTQSTGQVGGTSVPGGPDWQFPPARPPRVLTTNDLPKSEFTSELYDERTAALRYQAQQAERGNPEALYAMGIRFLNGIDVPKHPAMARQYLQAAKKRGSLRARAKLEELNRAPAVQSANIAGNPEAHSEEPSAAHLSVGP